jgi:hypothetical protein
MLSRDASAVMHDDSGALEFAGPSNGVSGRFDWLAFHQQPGQEVWGRTELSPGLGKKNGKILECMHGDAHTCVSCLIYATLQAYASEAVAIETSNMAPNVGTALSLAGVVAAIVASYVYEAQNIGAAAANKVEAIKLAACKFLARLLVRLPRPIHHSPQVPPTVGTQLSAICRL